MRVLRDRTKYLLLVTITFLIFSVIIARFSSGVNVDGIGYGLSNQEIIINGLKGGYCIAAFLHGWIYLMKIRNMGKFRRFKTVVVVLLFPILALCWMIASLISFLPLYIYNLYKEIHYYINYRL